MAEKTDRVKLAKYLNEYFTIIKQSFAKGGERISFDELDGLADDIHKIIAELNKIDYVLAGEFCAKKFIPFLNMMVKVDTDRNRMVKYRMRLKEAYRISARTSLESYMIYRDFDDSNPFYPPRYEILSGYIHYLQEVATNPKFRLLIFNAPSGYGKEIADFEPVLTKNGWKKHGDLVVGDYVLSPNGEFVKVTHIKPKIVSNRKVTFEDGETIVCHARHEWLVYDRLARKEKIVETDYLMKNCYEKSGRNRFLLPKKEIVKGEYKELPVDPYTFGVWLGNGSTYQGCITENLNGYNITSLLADLHKLGLGYKDVEKFIPDIYLISSIDQRLELLAGLLDANGYLEKTKQRYIYSTTNEQVKDGIIALISSFNWRSSVAISEPKVSSSGIARNKKVYSIGFSPDMEIPCKSERKKLTRLHKQRKIGISKVEIDNNNHIGNCITVDGGLYLVGKTLKVTHNSYPEKISEAWNFGVDPTGTVLSLCSNDSVVKGGSQSVIDEIKSEAFGEVFPKMKWSKSDKSFFLKETAGEWKLRDCKLLASYYASTVNSNVVGSRASQRIHIDDLYADYLEAMNSNLNEYFMNKYLTVWSKRFVQHLIPKVVVTGTLWASGDFIALLIDMVERTEKLKPHPKYKYCRTNKDETIVVIQVPALNEKGESTCPEVRSTAEVLQDKYNMDEYLFETNFQQKPTDPEALTFSNKNLRHYETEPVSDYIGKYAVIDATRKTGKDYFAMPIFKKVPNGEKFDYCLVDALFTKTATKDMYEKIVDKIIEHHIIFLVIESNVTSELKKQIETILASRGVAYCEIVEKYNTENKQARITDEKGVIKSSLVFPQQKLHAKSSDIGKFMDNLTSYNENGRNANDDAPDSCALFTREIIAGNSKPPKAHPIKRPF